MPTIRTNSGKAYGELDPNDPKNALITDIKLAPRNARGKVEYVAHVFVDEASRHVAVERRADGTRSSIAATARRRQAPRVTCRS